MSNSSQLKRVMVEAWLVVATVEVCILLALPFLAPDVSPLLAGVLNLALLISICAPVIYWRFAAAFNGFHPPAPGLVGARSMTSSRAVALAVITQITGLSLTAGGIWLQNQKLEQFSQQEFDRAAERTQLEIARRLNQTLYGLQGAKGAMAAHPNFKRKDFQAYVAARDMAAEFPGIRGFGLIERVPRDQLQAFTAAERADSAPGFSVKTTGSAPDLYVIKYVEPLSANLAAVGLDVGQEPVRRAAAERAVDTGEPALSGRIQLVQDQNRSPGFLYLVPVYKKNANPLTASERRRDLVGLLYAPIVAAELFEGTTLISDHLIDFALYEGAADQPEQLIFDSTQRGPMNVGADLKIGALDGRFSDLRGLSVGGHPFIVQFSSSPTFDAAQDRSSLTFIGVGGIVLSLLVAVTVWLLAVGRQRAQSQAQTMTAELNRMAQVVQHTASAVSIMDRQKRILWINPGFTQITGHCLEDALGKTPAELLSSGKSDPHALEVLRDSVERAAPCRVELINRRKDGREYWTDLELQPLFDEARQWVGFMEISQDITQKKQTQQRLEAAMREADALLSTLRTHAIVSETDHLGILTSVNEAFCRISGYSAEELIGRSHRVIRSEVQSEDFWADFWETISSGKPWRGEICNRRKDGSLYWVDSMIAPYVGETGEIERYVSIRTDITVRKQAAEKLQQSEQTFSAIFSQSATGMGLISSKGLLMAVNSALCELLGYTEEQLMRMTLMDLSHPDEWDADHRQVTSLMQGEIQRYQRAKRYLHHDGHVIWGLASVSAVRSNEGDLEFVIAQIVDITARKRAEEALTVSSALMEETQAIAKVGGWELNLASGELYWSAETYRIHEASPEDFNPTVDAGVGYFTPASRERITLALQAAVERGEGYDLELETHTTKGNLIQIRTTATATLENGTPVRLSGIFQDITERKQYERSLLEARELAEQATQSKGQFLANMSHELRTPMNAILGMLKLLGHTPLNVNQLDYVNKTEGAAKSLLGLLNDILDFSKMEAGKMELDPQPFRVDRLLRDLAVVLSANVGAKDIEVLYDLDPNLPECLLGDAMRLQQVLINLAGNAVKFTSTGQVVISLTREPDATASPDAVGITFAVKDSGIGIAPENQARIFSGFSQAEASTSRRFGGTGLGLSISQRLVQVMGGQIELASQLGEGSTFSFRLKLSVAPVEPPSTPALPAAVLAAQRVLVIDDNLVSCDLMLKMMRSFGWDVLATHSGEEALALALARARAPDGSFPFDCVFVDWQMQGMDGWETVRRLQALAQSMAGAVPRFIMLSANSRDDVSQRTQTEQDWLHGFLVKPVTASMLLDASLRLPPDADAPRRTQPSSRRQLAGMRVLVVEDNAINQQVAEELLSYEGALVSIAADGRQGVNAVAAARQQFDAVLMDIHMPVMDGYAATKAIREKLGLRQLPIIGLTANAMASDRQACLLAGMNEHLGKPFDMGQLVAMLLRMTGFQPNPQADPAHTPGLGYEQPAQPAQALEVVAPGGSAPDPQELDLPMALDRMGGMKSLYVRAARELQKTLAALDADLGAQVQSGGWAAATMLLHTVKGNAGTLGLVRLAGELAGLEKFSQTQPEPAQGEARLNALAAALELARPALAQAIALLTDNAERAAEAVPVSVSAPGLDLAACQGVVAGLIPLLEASDLSVLSVFAEARSELVALPEAQLDQLEAALQNLDLEDALAVCRTIMAT